MKESAPQTTRAYRPLPHIDSPELTQFVTFRLFDSLPQVLVRNYMTASKNMRAEFDEYLNKNLGCCYLQRHDVSAVIEEYLLQHHLQQYYLHAWVIMPNHIHLLFTPLENLTLQRIVRDLKAITAYRINKVLIRKGPFWARDYFDRYIRAEEHFYLTMKYIHENPVKAGLCKREEDWRFSSAWQR